MACVHLRQLYKLCEDHDIQIGSSGLIHVVCNQCGEQEVCPVVLTDEYDAQASRQTSRDGTAEGEPTEKPSPE